MPTDDSQVFLLAENTAKKILERQSWIEVEETLSTVAKILNKRKVDVYERVIRCLTLDERQHLVGLLASHIKIYPRDYWAYTWLPSSSRQLIEKARAMSGVRQISVANTNDESLVPDYLEPIEEE